MVLCSTRLKLIQVESFLGRKKVKVIEGIEVPIPEMNEEKSASIEPNASDLEIDNATSNPYEVGSIESRIFELCKQTSCSTKELSIILEMTEEELLREFEDVITRGLTVCKILLRRTQMLSARVGDAKMMTFLGKNVLGQEEKVESANAGVTIILQTNVPRSLADVQMQTTPSVSFSENRENR